MRLDNELVIRPKRPKGDDGYRTFSVRPVVIISWKPAFIDIQQRSFHQNFTGKTGGSGSLRIFAFIS